MSGRPINCSQALSPVAITLEFATRKSNVCLPLLGHMQRAFVQDKTSQALGHVARTVLTICYHQSQYLHFLLLPILLGFDGQIIEVQYSFGPSSTYRLAGCYR